MLFFQHHTGENDKWVVSRRNCWRAAGMQRTAPVMADGRIRIQAASQRERKVSARTILTSNSLLLFPERVEQNNTKRPNNAFASKLWKRHKNDVSLQIKPLVLDESGLLMSKDIIKGRKSNLFSTGGRGYFSNKSRFLLEDPQSH